MTAVTIDCPRCETRNELAPGALLVDLGWPEPDESVGGRATWICSACEHLVSIPVRWSLLLLLVSHGAPLFDEDDNEQASVNPEPAPGGPPLTYDDLLDLHRLLDTPTWFDVLVEWQP